MFYDRHVVYSRHVWYMYVVICVWCVLWWRCGEVWRVCGHDVSIKFGVSVVYVGTEVATVRN